MIQISKKKLPENILSKLFSLFFEIVGKKDDKDEFKKIIDDIFSESEQIMIIKRIAIFYLLLKDIDKTAICDTLKVSKATVCKFYLLTKKSDGIVFYMNKILKQEKIRDFFDDIFYELFARPGKPGTNWKVGWQHKFEKERKKQTGL